MKVTKLRESTLVRSIQPHLTSYIRRCNPDGKNRIRPSPKERRAFEVLLGLSNITECIDQLYYSIELLSGFRKSSSHELINRHDYIVYSIENVYMRITSVFDRCLRLSNLVFDIGIPDKECRESTIIQNVKIKNTTVARTLKDLNRFVSSFRQVRNELAHSKCFSDRSLNEMQGFYYLIDAGEPEMKKFQRVFKVEADNYVKEKKRELLEKVQQLEQHVESYFVAISQRVTGLIEQETRR